MVSSHDARHDVIVLPETPTPPPWWTAFISDPEEEPALDAAPAGGDGAPTPVAEEPSVDGGPADI